MPNLIDATIHKYVYGNMTALMTIGFVGLEYDYILTFYCDVNKAMVRHKDGTLVKVFAKDLFSDVPNGFEGPMVCEVQIIMDLLKSLRRSWENNPRKPDGHAIRYGSLKPARATD
jgi:hypothetical protein